MAIQSTLRESFVDGASIHYEWATYPGEDQLRALLSVGDLAGAAQILPLYRIGLIALAGPLVTYLLTLALFLFARRTRAPLAYALGLVANLRAIPLAISLLLQPGLTGADEETLGWVLGTHPLLLALPGVEFFFWGSMGLWGSLPAGRRRLPMLGGIVGMIAGLAA